MHTSSNDTSTRPVDPWEASPAVPLTRTQLKVLLRRSDGPGLRYLFGHVVLGPRDRQPWCISPSC